MVIGETSFCSSIENLKADAIFTYHIYFIDGEDIYQFYINYICSESEKECLSELTDIFDKKVMGFIGKAKTPAMTYFFCWKKKTAKYHVISWIFKNYMKIFVLT